MQKPIYEILSDIMDAQNLTIAETSRLCKLPDSTIRGIMTRKQKSTALEVAFKLSQGLHVSLEHLNGLPEKSSTVVTSKVNEKITAEAKEVAKAYDKADFKSKNIARQALDLPPLEPPAMETSAVITQDKAV